MSVTDTDKSTANTIESRNTLSDMERNLAGALGVTAPNCPDGGTINSGNEARKQARRLEHRAQKYADVCGKCGRELELAETVYISCVWAGHTLMGSYTRHYAPVCVGCAAPHMKGEGRYYNPRIDRCERQPCETCERPVVWKSTGRDSYRRHVFCCEQCQWTHYNGERNKESVRSREKVCPVCDTPFTATRRDAKACSPACKQKAYRERSRP